MRTWELPVFDFQLANGSFNNGGNRDFYCDNSSEMEATLYIGQLVTDTALDGGHMFLTCSYRVVGGERGKEWEEGIEMVVGEQAELGEGVEMEMIEDKIRDNREHEYMEQLLVEDEEKRTAEDKSRQDEFDQEALKLTLEEEGRFQNQDQERLREEQEFEWNQQWYNHETHMRNLQAQTFNVSMRICKHKNMNSTLLERGCNIDNVPAKRQLALKDEHGFVIHLESRLH
nr:hypothetical protein [Tanacetum cinerariifolium]